MEVLGVDIGNVISRLDTDTPGNFNAPMVEINDAIRVIAWLSRMRFAHQVHLVSKCGDRMQQRSREFLAQCDFFARTHVLPQNLHFCYKRHEKAPICQRLGVTHFIDDRAEVLGHLVGIVPHLYLFNPQEKEMRHFSQSCDKAIIVLSWLELEELLLK